MPFLCVDHWPLTIAEEADLVRRGVVKHPLTAEQRVREEGRAAARAADRETRRRWEADRVREQAVRQATALLREARQGG